MPRLDASEVNALDHSTESCCNLDDNEVVCYIDGQPYCIECMESMFSDELDHIMQMVGMDDDSKETAVITVKESDRITEFDGFVIMHTMTNGRKVPLHASPSLLNVAKLIITGEME